MTVKEKKLKLTGVKSKWVVRVPMGARIEVSEGKKVKKGEVLLTGELMGLNSYNASWILSKMSSKKLAEMKDKLYNKKFNEGDLLFTGGGWFPKKLFSPCSGKFCGIDEFLNIQFQTVVCGRREIRAPVEAKVLKVEKERLVLEFNSLKYEGTGLVDGKVWGESDLIIRNKISELTNILAGKVVFTTDPNPAYIIKAQVVGAAGLVILEPVEIDFREMEVRFPVMSLGKTEWDHLMSNRSSEEEKRVLLNSKVGRLLLVVQ